MKTYPPSVGNKCRAEKREISKKGLETDYIEEKLQIMIEKIREISEKIDMVYDRIDNMDEEMKVAINEDSRDQEKDVLC